MSANLSAVFYLISGILFILALRGLSSPETSRQGNYFGIAGMIIAVVVTFLAVGTFGSFVAGSKNLIELLIQKSKPYIYSTSLPPAIVEATRASLKIIKTNQELHERLYDNINFFIKNAKLSDIKLNKSFTPIQSITIGNPEDTMKIQRTALENGLFLQGIRYPTVPKNQDKLRISITSKHTRRHLEKLIKFLSKEL